MGALFGVVAFLVALAGLLVTVGHVGYLALLSAAANRRGSSGESTAEYVRAQLPPASAIAVAALVALICACSGDGVVDLVALVLGAGSSVAGSRALRSTHSRFSGEG